jgi:hypothetical protein
MKGRAALAAVVASVLLTASTFALGAGVPASSPSPKPLDARQLDGGALAAGDAGEEDGGEPDGGALDAGSNGADAGYWQETFAAAQAVDGGQTENPLVGAAEQLPATPIVAQDAPSGDQQAAARPGNAPLDRSLRGFIPIPGTRAIFKLGGFARVMLVSTSKAVTEQDQWVTSTIPVQGQSGYQTGEEFNINGNQSRLNIEFRSPSPLGSVRVYYENDFSDTDNQDFVYNLRYFYVQAANVLAGWSDSLMVDVDAQAETLDLQGPNGAVKRKHALVRWFFLVKHQGEQLTYFAASLEQPSSQLPSSVPGTPRSVLPDAVVQWRIEGKRGHFEVSGVARDIGFQNATTGVGQSVFGFALNVSGNLKLWGKDHVSAQLTHGHGAGYYIADTSGGGYDAAMNADGHLEVIPLSSGYIAYTHHWTEQLWSATSWGFLTLDDSAYSVSLGPSALKGSIYVSLNLVLTLTRRFTIGVEGLYGHNQAISNAGGNAYRGILLMQYNFF